MTMPKMKPVAWLHIEFAGAKFINWLDQNPGVGWTKTGLFTEAQLDQASEEGKAEAPIPEKSKFVRELRNQLVAAQADNERLRDAMCKPHHGHDINEVFKILEDALAIPCNTEALRQHDAELVPPAKIEPWIYPDEPRHDQFGQMKYNQGWNECREVVIELADKIRKGEPL